MRISFKGGRHRQFLKVACYYHWIDIWDKPTILLAH